MRRAWEEFVEIKRDGEAGMMSKKLLTPSELRQVVIQLGNHKSLQPIWGTAEINHYYKSQLTDFHAYGFNISATVASSSNEDEKTNQPRRRMAVTVNQHPKRKTIANRRRKMLTRKAATNRRRKKRNQTQKRRRKT